MAKILLVEDEPGIREMLSRRLVKRGYHVTAASDGEEACRLAVSEWPDLVLMDMKMPVLDGLDATRRLKADERTRAIPVIGLSCYAMQGDQEKALEAGCNDYETKPIDLSSLLGKIEALLQRRTEE
ncbi:MAG TPA: response regulator [Gemmataceae bacterium]|nr:response regulator [Gemmataceae bacterium]